MGYEPGGRADKLGNRYEGRWVAKQLLRLLNEDLRSVTIEAIGEDEKGVDLWIETKDGKRQAHQCKARNGSDEFWTINDLKNRSIFNNLKYQLDRNQDIEFVFVSGVPATVLGDICDSARNSPGDYELFYKYQIEGVGEKRLKAFNEFAEAINIDPNSNNGRREIYDYLRRTYIISYSDDQNAWNDLINLGSFLLYGAAPESVISVLTEYAENNNKLGYPITSDQLIKYLETQNIYLKNLPLDSRVMPAIKKLQYEFKSSIIPGLINRTLIDREETQKCLEQLERLETGKNVMLHGNAGSGKSAVLLELFQEIEQKDWLCLPLRLDRREPKNTAYLFGKEMGLPDSPVHCLVSAAAHRKCILILDQLDALRWTNGHSANALDVCKEIVNQVMSFRREGKDISVVWSCRTFDMKNDQQIKNWLGDEREMEIVEIEVGLLPETVVKEKLGQAYEQMTIKQRDILSNPLYLSLYMELSESKDLLAFQSSTQLMRRYWDKMKMKIEGTGIPVEDINALLNCIVKCLDREGKISAPDRIIAKCSMKAFHEFKSLGILLHQGNTINFCHQAHLDFHIALRVLSKIDEGETILNWLGNKENQTLFRREQLKQALTLLSDESERKFLESIKLILSSDVRFHLKHLVIELLGQMNPISSEIADYCICLLR